MQDDFIPFKGKRARLIRLPITKFNADLQGIFWFGANPVHIGDFAAVAIEMFIFVTMPALKEPG